MGREACAHFGGDTVNTLAFSSLSVVQQLMRLLRQYRADHGHDPDEITLSWRDRERLIAELSRDPRGPLALEPRLDGVKLRVLP